VDTVAQDLADARPQFMTSVPRLFEKIYARAMEKAEEGGAAKAAIARWAVKAAKEWAKIASQGEDPGMLLNLKHSIANKLVFSKWRAAMGGRVRALVSGGAPLSLDLGLVFYGAGLPIYQGYGLTESSPTITANYPKANRIGSVGKPISGVTIKIAEDGEILCSGPNVMRGYYNRDEETSLVLETDSGGRVWLRTGDIGSFHHRPQKRFDKNQRREIRRSATDRERHQAQPLCQPGRRHRRRAQVSIGSDRASDGRA
jgi:long-chain acyl-CoA synthetase